MSGPHDAAPRALQTEGMSLHRQLFLVLREQIVRGALLPGSGLPTEQALCAQYGVSRITVRRALQDLADQGFVERRHGRGTFVHARIPEARPTPALTLTEGLRKAHMETAVEVLDSGPRPAPARVVQALRLHEGDEALYVLRVRRHGDEPLMVTESWLPAKFARWARASTLRKRALFEILQKAGVKIGRVVQEITAESADPLLAERLATHIGAPVLRVTRLVHDVSGTPVQHLTVYLSPDRSRVLMDIAAEDVETLSAGFVAHDVARKPPTSGR